MVRIYQALSAAITCTILALPVFGTTDEPFKCEWIGVASYQGFDHKGQIRWSAPPSASFWSVCTLQGPPCEVLPIRYDFGTKNGNDLPPKNWIFHKDLMPKKNSKWIILIPNGVPRNGVFETYHGTEGRMAYSRSNLDKVLDGMEHQSPNKMFPPELRQTLRALIENWKPLDGDQARKWLVEAKN